MTKFVIRKLGSTGDTCVAVTEQELAEQIRPRLAEGFSAALRTEEATQYVGSDLEQVTAAVQAEVTKGIEELEVLLIPRVAGG